MHIEHVLYSAPRARIIGAPRAHIDGLPHEHIIGVPCAHINGLPCAHINGLPCAHILGAPCGHINGSFRARTIGAPCAHINGSFRAHLIGALSARSRRIPAQSTGLAPPRSLSTPSEPSTPLLLAHHIECCDSISAAPALTAPPFNLATACIMAFSRGYLICHLGR
jgi:hypothetical protein